MQAVAWYCALGSIVALIDWHYYPEDWYDFPRRVWPLVAVIVVAIWPIVAGAMLIDTWNEKVVRRWRRWRVARALARARRQLDEAKAVLSDPQYEALLERVRELEELATVRYG